MPRKSPLKRRADWVRDQLREHALDGLLVTDRANVRYLSGFTGSIAAVLLTRDRLQLIVDFRYFEQAGREAPEAELVHVERAFYDDAIARAIASVRIRRLAFEADVASYASIMALEAHCPGIELVPSRNLVGAAREVKEPHEIACIRRAAAITSQAVTAVLATLAAGQTEQAIALEIERQMKRLGAERLAFETLVAVGAQSALPHPRPGDRPLQRGDWLLIDCGAVVDGYCADMTRTLVFGAPDAQQRKVYAAVQAALQAGLNAVAPGRSAAGVDRACRRVLERHGLLARFGHDTGHGVGLELHEGPRIARDNDQPLEAGMVLTVEPGVYVPGWGGVRLEELVLVTARGAEVLTTAPVALSPLCTLTQ